MAATDPIEAQHAQPAPRAIPAWLLSCGLHAGLLVMFFLALRLSPRGAEVPQDRPAGIVLARRSADQTTYFDDETEHDEQETADPSDTNTTDLPLPAAELFSTTLPDELPEAGNPTMPADHAGNLIPHASTFTQGRPAPKRFGPAVQTSVFGVTGVGSKFVYVFDRSGSMSDFNGRPLAAAKAELLASLQELDEVHQYQIIFYNNEPYVFNPSGETPRMWWADDRGRRLAKRFVNSVTAAGGTEHMGALQLALGMHPDILFRLTDANEPQISAQQLDQLRRLNGGSTAIHTIEFGYQPSADRDNFLMRLAKQNGGRHAYIDISGWSTGRR